MKIWYYSAADSFVGGLQEHFATRREAQIARDIYNESCGDDCQSFEVRCVNFSVTRAGMLAAMTWAARTVPK